MARRPRRGVRLLVAIQSLLLVTSLFAAIAPTPIAAATRANYALNFDGTNDFVTFGNSTVLGAAAFTLELWVKRTGTGTATGTGTGGLTNAIPLLTKGRGEAESPANLNMNYFLGLDATSGVIVADFEDTAGGANHPLTGTNPVTMNAWHHIAVTYTSNTWNFYLDGNLDKTFELSGVSRFHTRVDKHPACRPRHCDDIGRRSVGRTSWVLPGTSLTRRGSGALRGRRRRSRRRRMPKSTRARPD